MIGVGGKTNIQPCLFDSRAMFLTTHAASDTTCTIFYFYFFLGGGGSRIWTQALAFASKRPTTSATPSAPIISTAILNTLYLCSQFQKDFPSHYTICNLNILATWVYINFFSLKLPQLLSEMVSNCCDANSQLLPLVRNPYLPRLICISLKFFHSMASMDWNHDITTRTPWILVKWLQSSSMT